MWISKKKYNKMLKEIEEQAEKINILKNHNDLLENKITNFTKTYEITIITSDDKHYDITMSSLGDENYIREKIKNNFLFNYPAYLEEDIKGIIVTQYKDK